MYLQWPGLADAFQYRITNMGYRQVSDFVFRGVSLCCGGHRTRGRDVVFVAGRMELVSEVRTRIINDVYDGIREYMVFISFVEKRKKVR